MQKLANYLTPVFKLYVSRMVALLLVMAMTLGVTPMAMMARADVAGLQVTVCQETDWEPAKSTIYPEEMYTYLLNVYTTAEDVYAYHGDAYVVDTVLSENIDLAQVTAFNTPVTNFDEFSLALNSAIAAGGRHTIFVAGDGFEFSREWAPDRAVGHDVTVSIVGMGGNTRLRPVAGPATFNGSFLLGLPSPNIHLVFENITLDGGGALPLTGIILFEGSTVTIGGNAVITNFATRGVNVDGGHLILDGGAITGNGAFANAGTHGGGVLVSGGHFAIYSGLIEWNRASLNGGAIALGVNGRLSMYDGTIANNMSINNGGAIGFVGTPDAAFYESIAIDPRVTFDSNWAVSTPDGRINNLLDRSHRERIRPVVLGPLSFDETGVRPHAFTNHDVQVMAQDLSAESVTVRFHFDGRTEDVVVELGTVVPYASMPVPATRYGRIENNVSIPAQVFMGWFTQANPIHQVGHPNRATAFDVTQPIVQSMLDNQNVLHLYGSWLMFGDVNGDGEITPLDVTLINLFLSNQITANDIILETARVSGGVFIEAGDAVLLNLFLGGELVILGPVDPNHP